MTNFVCIKHPKILSLKKTNLLEERKGDDLIRVILVIEHTFGDYMYEQKLHSSLMAGKMENEKPRRDVGKDVWRNKIKVCYLCCFN